MANKILISPGFGAGWSTWIRGPGDMVALTWQPIIDALEAGEGPLDESHPAVVSLVERLGEFCTLGVQDLTVAEVLDDESFHIHVRDGYESLRCGCGPERGMVFKGGKVTDTWAE